jgi:hypothetical protein
VVAIATAGSPQLWAPDLKKDEIEVLAGSGFESLVDGPDHATAMA